MSLARKLQGVIVSLFIFFLPVGTIPSFAQQNLNGVVVSDNLLATRAGMEILEKGGNAVDAAVATAFALGVVNPASSGLGGGGFMVIYQAKEKKAHTLDFREMAPKAAVADAFVREGRVVP